MVGMWVTGQIWCLCNRSVSIFRCDFTDNNDISLGSTVYWSLRMYSSVIIGSLISWKHCLFDNNCENSFDTSKLSYTDI